MSELIHNPDVPVAPEDYSQAFQTENLVFTAGQVPMKNDGTILLDASIEEQTRQCLFNIEQILQQTGLRMDDVIKTTVYLTDLNDFETMNTTYQAHFGQDMPARSVVEVSKILKDVDVKIEAIASKDE